MLDMPHTSNLAPFDDNLSKIIRPLKKIEWVFMKSLELRSSWKTILIEPVS